MQEITTTFTMEVTLIERHVTDERADLIPTKDTIKRIFEDSLKEAIAVDDVHISNLKLFIRDEEETNEN